MINNLNLSDKQSINMKVVIVDKGGDLKTLNIKNFIIDELYKKCALRKPDDFKRQTEWAVTVNKKKYYIALYAKTKGRANTENKYDLPPPVDTCLFYGSMALVNFAKSDGDETDACDLDVEEWEKIYEKLFGGFEDIENTDDEEETDELADVPKSQLTKNGGYLKDDFVVDTSEDELENEDEDVDEDDEEVDDEDDDDDDDDDDEQLVDEDDEEEEEENGDNDDEEEFDDDTSELSESVYEYSD
jgi:hypothetical protein